MEIDKFRFFCRNLRPGLDESVVDRINTKGTFSAKCIHRQRVEEFVGEDNGGAPVYRVSSGEVCAELCLAGIEIISKSCLHTAAQGWRAFNKNISHRRKKLRQFLLSPAENILRKKAATGAELHKFDLLR